MELPSASKIVKEMAEFANERIRHIMGRIRTTVVKFLALVLQQSFHCLATVMYLGKKRVVPPVMNPLLLKSATALAAEIRSGKTSSEQVVRAYIDRINEVQPYINAVVDDRFDEALEEAKQADLLAASRSPEDLAKEKPLLGVPFSVKLLISVKGLRCTAGCKIFQDLRAHEDAVLISLMKKAGAICIANTNSPEFGFHYETYNKVHGTTRNPYDTRRTCGGSSGGEGALIGAAGSVIGIGNDMGGSCRLPAFNCCIFGHKPTNGLLPNKGVFPVPPENLERIITAGPMCRYAEDMTTLMKILVGDRAEELKIGKQVNFKDIKFYYMLGNGGDMTAPKLDGDLMELVLKVARYFEKVYDTTYEQVKVKDMQRSFELWCRTLTSGVTEKTFDQLTGGKVQIHPEAELIKFICRRSDFTIGSIAVFNCKRAELLFGTKLSKTFRDSLNRIDEELQKLLVDNAVLLLPTFSKTATYHNEMSLSVGGVGYMAIFNILGYPVTQCTMGLGRNGLPIGLQVAAARNQDYLTLSVAKEIEKAYGGWVQPGLTASNMELNMEKLEHEDS